MDMTKSIYGYLNYEPKWYALYTRYHHEKKVVERLKQKDVTTYLPLYETCFSNKDKRIKKVLLPLFSCYLFVNIVLKDRLTVLQTDGVVKLVSFNGIPAPIPDEQIHLIRLFLKEGYTIYPEHYLTIGEKIEVVMGPFRGVRGFLKSVKNHSRVVINIDQIKQALSIDIDTRWVRPVLLKKA